MIFLRKNPLAQKKKEQFSQVVAMKCKKGTWKTRKLIKVIQVS